MELPHWVEEDIELLLNDFTGHIVIEECYRGGVTRVDTKTSRTGLKNGRDEERLCEIMGTASGAPHHQ